jgi:hypothetical protein
MNEQQASGQAFPTMERGGGGLDLADPGMTLRDYLAAKALPIVQSGCQKQGNDFLHPDQFEMAAIDAYKLADAMLAARALPQGAPDA